MPRPTCSPRRLVGLLALFALLGAACGSSGADADREPAVATTTTTAAVPTEAPTDTASPGGYSFDRSDPEAGIQNIRDAFATDQATAECIFEAWGDVANVPPAELTPELMTFPICGTSIFQMITGDGRFTGRDDG